MCVFVLMLLFSGLCTKKSCVLTELSLQVKLRGVNVASEAMEIGQGACQTTRFHYSIFTAKRRLRMLSHAQLRFPSRHHLAGPLPVAVSSQYAQHHCRNKRVCRWAPDRQEDPQDDAPHTNTSSSTANADPMQSRRLINQLLQIQSLQSVDLSGSADEGQQDSLSSGVSGHQQPQQNAAGSTLFDDPAAEDYDPLLLDML